jgi:hypothetical protein
MKEALFIDGMQREPQRGVIRKPRAKPWDQEASKVQP